MPLVRCQGKGEIDDWVSVFFWGGEHFLSDGKKSSILHYKKILGFNDREYKHILGFNDREYYRE